MQIEKIENMHYVIIGVTTFCIFALTLFVRLDMKEHQKKRIGYLNVLVVSFAWLDFIGDLTWTWQRFHAHYVRGEQEDNQIFGIVSAVIMANSIVVMSYNVVGKILIKHKKSISHDKVTSYAFITLLFVACTDPEVIMFFPWNKNAYKLELKSPFPNGDCVRVTLMKLWEDIPEFILQVVYLASGNFDVFTLLNLIFTMVMLMYFVAGKLLLLVLDPGKDEGESSPSDLGVHNKQNRIRPGNSPSPRAEESRPAQVTRKRSFKIAAELPMMQILDKLDPITSKVWNGKKVTGAPEEMMLALAELQDELCIPGWEHMNLAQKVSSVAHELGIETVKTPKNSGRIPRKYRPYHLVKRELIKEVEASARIKVEVTSSRPWGDFLNDLKAYCDVDDSEWDSSDIRKRTHLVADRLFKIRVKEKQTKGLMGLFHWPV